MSPLVLGQSQPGVAVGTRSISTRCRRWCSVSLNPVSPLVLGQSQPGVNGYEDPSSQRRLLSIDSRGIGCFYNSPIVSNVELAFFEDFFDY